MTAALDHLCRLIRIPSVSSMSNRPVIDYAAAVLSTHNWTTREFVYLDPADVEKVNLIAAPPGQPVSQREVELIFLCHTDTVPYAQDWRSALEPFRDGDTLRGCGACDVKGFLACLLEAAGTTGARWIDGLRIVLSADEEVGCIGSHRLIAADLLHPRRIVIGEPTSLHVARAGKGYCLARIAVHGREAHSAHPDQGLSSIYAAARLITAIEQLSQELTTQRHAFFHPPFTTLNVGTIIGGTAKNIVPGQAELLVEWRPIPGQPEDRLPAALRKTLDRLQCDYPGLTTDLSILRNGRGFETSATSSLVTSIEQATKRPAASIAFGSEASAWSNLAEEVVVFGPGDMRTAHSNRECLPLAELASATVVVRRLMQHYPHLSADVP